MGVAALSKTKMLGLIVACLMIVGTVSLLPIRAQPSGTYSNHIVFIIMENHPLSSFTCSGCAPYMESLPALASDYVGPPSNTYNPSLPNYFLLTSGQAPSCAVNDGNPSSCNSAAANLVDKFNSAGVSWKAYMEDMPSNCYSSDSGNYWVHHNPFPYYTDSAATTGCASYDVPAGTSGSTSCTVSGTAFASTLINDLNGTTPPQFAWVTPNHYDDIHDCAASTANSYLNVLVQQILTTKTFETDHTATVAITFDEPSSGTYGTTPVYFAVAGPGAAHVSSNTYYSHCNWLATVEANWNLGDFGHCDHGATVMSEFFTSPNFGLAASPTSVTTVDSQEQYPSPRALVQQVD